MPLYVLDTDIAGFMQQNYPAVLRHLEALAPDDSVVTTIITFNEDISGWQAKCHRAQTATARSAAYDQLQRALDFYCGKRILPFDAAAALCFEQLRANDRRIGTNDLSIAAITLTVGGILVTRNHVDFARVPGLTLKDWTI